MRRDEIIRGIENLLRALEDSGAFSGIRNLRTSARQERGDPAAFVEIYGKLTVAKSTFSAFELKLLDIFELKGLFDSKTWALIPGKEEPPTRDLAILTYHAQLFESYGKNTIELLRRDSDSPPPALIEADQKGQQKSVELGKLSVFVREAATYDLPIRTLIEILSEISSLYDTVCKIYNIDFVEISLASMDSGSEKSVDIIGVAEAISKLSGFILECWDRVRFGKMQSANQAFKSASDGLSLLVKLMECVSSGDLTESEAEKLKRLTLKNVEGFFNNGAYTLDMENIVPLRPASLPVERRKLITFSSNERPLSPSSAAELSLGNAGDLTSVKRARSRANTKLPRSRSSRKPA